MFLMMTLEFQIQGLSLKTAAIERLSSILIKLILNKHSKINGPIIDTWGFFTVIKWSVMNFKAHTKIFRLPPPPPPPHNDCGTNGNYFQHQSLKKYT